MVKGTLTTFRQERQLVAMRLIRPKDTNQEASWWSHMADAKRKELSKPWVNTQEDMADVAAEQKRDELQSKREQKRDLYKTQQKREWEEQREAKRTLREEQMNKHALEGSNVLPQPWD
jgi:tRNA G10  N-methylase Trm11